MSFRIYILSILMHDKFRLSFENNLGVAHELFGSFIEKG